MSPEVFVVVLTTRSVTPRASCRREHHLVHAERNSSFGVMGDGHVQGRGPGNSTDMSGRTRKPFTWKNVAGYCKLQAKTCYHFPT